MIFWSIFTAIHLASLIFLAISMLRLRDYMEKHRFEESQYTMLLGFIRLPHVVILYIVGTAAWVFSTAVYSVIMLNG